MTEPAPPSGVVVTGGASGIGAACAELLAGDGRPVAVWDVRGAPAAAEAIAERTGVTVVGLEVDVCDEPAVAGAVAATREALGAVGGLVHAAGVAGSTPLGRLTDESWSRIVDVHLKAAAFVVQALLDDLRATPGAAIVTIGSLSSWLGFGHLIAYSSAKAGILGLTRSMASTLGPEGIRVNAVCPGYIDTGMLRPERHPAFIAATPHGRIGTPLDDARAIRYLLSDEASFETWTHMMVDGGVAADIRVGAAASRDG
jgi:NAD(P)-dependent dehydrogenase (short-subunit alcohol dehydrogenase family)